MTEYTNEEIREVLDAVQYSDRYCLARDDYHGPVRITGRVRDSVVDDIADELNDD